MSDDEPRVEQKDGKFIITSRVCDADVNKNDRIYSTDAVRRMVEMVEKARAKGRDPLEQVKVSVGGDVQPSLRGEPVEIGGRVYVDPKMELLGLNEDADGNLMATVRIEDQADVVDQLAVRASRPSSLSPSSPTPLPSSSPTPPSGPPSP